jgi:hypothetical protein
MNRTLTVLLAFLVATSALTGVVVAQEDDADATFAEKLIEPGDQGAPGIGIDIARAAARATSLPDRLYTQLVGDEGNASKHAQDFQDEFNQNNDTIQAYSNKRINASTSLDVLELTFTDEAGNQATVYLAATVSNESYQNMRVVDNTSRTVDESITADWYLSRNAASELEAFVADFAEPDRDLTQTYKAKMIAKYASDVNGTLWNSTEADA